MKALLGLLLLVGASAARADLYRWVDPQTGSVKFSSVPPPASQGGVEVIPYRGGAAPARPAASGAVALELRWHELLAGISQTPVSPASRAALERQLRDFAAMSAELDRLDPGGATRRHAEAEATLQRLLKVDR